MMAESRVPVDSQPQGAPASIGPIMYRCAPPFRSVNQYENNEEEILKALLLPHISVDHDDLSSEPNKSDMSVNQTSCNNGEISSTNHSKDQMEIVVDVAPSTITTAKLGKNSCTVKRKSSTNDVNTGAVTKALFPAPNEMLPNDVRDWTIPNADPSTSRIQTAEYEAKRLHVLRSYMLLGLDVPITHKDKSTFENNIDGDDGSDDDRCALMPFQKLVSLTKRLLNVRHVTLDLVDMGRLFVLASTIDGLRERPRRVGLCGHTILRGTSPRRITRHHLHSYKDDENDLLIVPDRLQDDRFRDITELEALGVRFCAGVPLLSPEGYKLGSLCVADVVPRPHGLTKCERDALRDLSASAINAMIQHRQRYWQKRLMMNATNCIAWAAHDVQLPLSSVQLALQNMEKRVQQKSTKEASETQKVGHASTGFLEHDAMHQQMLATAAGCTDTMVDIAQDIVKRLLNQHHLDLERSEGDPFSLVDRKLTPSSMTTIMQANSHRRRMGFGISNFCHRLQDATRCYLAVAKGVEVGGTQRKRRKLSIQVDDSVPERIQGVDESRLFRILQKLLIRTSERTSMESPLEMKLQVLNDNRQKNRLMVEIQSKGFHDIDAKTKASLFEEKCQSSRGELNLKHFSHALSSQIQALGGTYTVHSTGVTSGDYSSLLFRAEKATKSALDEAHRIELCIPFG